jgi:hypothetical protein
MALVISILLVGAGAVMVWGVTAEVGGIDVDVVGWIALVVGLMGVVFSMLAYARGRPDERHARRGYGVRP